MARTDGERDRGRRFFRRCSTRPQSCGKQRARYARHCCGGIDLDNRTSDLIAAMAGYPVQLLQELRLDVLPLLLLLLHRIQRPGTVPFFFAPDFCLFTCGRYLFVYFSVSYSRCAIPVCDAFSVASKPGVVLPPLFAFASACPVLDVKMFLAMDIFMNPRPSFYLSRNAYLYLGGALLPLTRVVVFLSYSSRRTDDAATTSMLCSTHALVVGNV